MKNSELWANHHSEWRHPSQIISQWKEADEIETRLLEYKTQGRFWETLEKLGVTLLIGREYEHLVLALSAECEKPRITYLPLPHPSGIVVDRGKGRVHIASTRNPNQIFTFGMVGLGDPRTDTKPVSKYFQKSLIPLFSHFYPGSLYLHDLAMVGEKLYGNAVGHNAVVKLNENGTWEKAWWPRCVENGKNVRFDKNFIQLNSIAPGSSLKHSFFSASTDRMSSRRPGHLNFPVDKRGVIFSGATREPIAFGLTRPHSARIHDEQVWVANSGYGEIGRITKGKFQVVYRFESWTRGLSFYKNFAIVGCSRVIPKFSQYAPGLDVHKSQCAIHLFDYTKGKIEGSLIWPNGNQIFAIDWLPLKGCNGFPFVFSQKRQTQSASELYKDLFYNYGDEQKKKGF